MPLPYQLLDLGTNRLVSTPSRNFIMRFKKYTKTQLIQAVKENYSIRQVLVTLNVSPHGGNYRVINSYIEKLGLDTSHFKGQGWSKSKKIGYRSSIKDYLSNKQPIQSYKLKNRLFLEGLKDKKCEVCGITHWNGELAPLELDHINGNHKDNTLSNLKILCPNCHAQTPTYRSKNRR